MEQNDMELIYDKFSNTIYRTAFSYCKNHADAEDITSDVFIKCFTGKYAYDSDEHLKAWQPFFIARVCPLGIYVLP
jgi:DNA-directed RNA polymerase specialized sigma24 family protein